MSSGSEGDGQVLGVAAGKVAAGGADVRVEDGVAAEDVLSNQVSHVVRRVSGQVHCLALELPDVKDLVVVKQLVEGALVLFPGDVVPLRKPLLDAADPLPNTDLWPLPFLGQPVLQILGGRQMVRVDVGLQQAVDGVPLFLDQGEQGIGRRGGDGVAGLVKVEDGVDDDGHVGGGVGNDVLPSRCLWLEDGVNDGLHGEGGWGDGELRALVWCNGRGVGFIYACEPTCWLPKAAKGSGPEAEPGTAELRFYMTSGKERSCSHRPRSAA